MTFQRHLLPLLVTVAELSPPPSPTRPNIFSRAHVWYKNGNIETTYLNANAYSQAHYVLSLGESEFSGAMHSEADMWRSALKKHKHTRSLGVEYPCGLLSNTSNTTSTCSLLLYKIACNVLYQDLSNVFIRHEKKEKCNLHEQRDMHERHSNTPIVMVV